MRATAAILFLSLLAVSCTMPPRPSQESGGLDYFGLRKQRSTQMQSAAYLIDLRANDAGRKFSLTVELYLAGDSVGLYGRSYLGHGAFRGQIIGNQILVYFPDANEYYAAPLEKLRLGNECAGSAEMLLYLLSFLSGREEVTAENAACYENEITLHEGRFYRTIYLKGDGRFPRREKLVDPVCGDSLGIRYRQFQDDFPYYRVEEIAYRNAAYSFRARGFVREQKYNVNLPGRKFAVEVPADATRLESLSSP